MTLRIREISLGLREDKSILPDKVCRKLRLKPGSLTDWRIVRESIDARKKNDIRRIYTIDFKLANANKEAELLKRNKNLSSADGGQGPRGPLGRNHQKYPGCIARGGGRAEAAQPAHGADGSGNEKPAPRAMANPPVIVGFGPCGMFSALYLARMGMKPVILERGKRIEDRVKDVDLFWKEGKLDPVSNVQFGEGGAGAFSDGKLNSGIKNSYRTEMVLQELADHGAPEEILYKQNPHVGTDILRNVVASIRNEILELGGEFRYETCLTGFREEDGRVTAAVTQSGEIIDTDVLVIAPGHSARDTFENLLENGLEFKQKPFSIGARIEHLRAMIDVSQYGSEEAAEILGAADYKLSYKCESGRGVYTFCMCPGGYVVASSSEEGCVVTNGMSYHSRDAVNSNSALLVGVDPEDFGSDHPLAGVEFQRKWERAAFELGGGDYRAPAQLSGDFLKGIPSEGCRTVAPEYRPGVKWTDLSKCLPEFAVAAMREAIPALGRRLKGFDCEDAVLTGVESRSSSPVRIIRDDDLQAAVKGIFPAGEGAGYAGGIMSAAVDGVRAAEKICEMFYRAY